MAPTKRTGRSVLVIVLALSWWSLPGYVEAQFDDFNDGDDRGWTRISPLAFLGVPGVFTITNGGYRIQTIRPSPNPAMLGPPRAYSLRRDVVYTDFYESVDLVNWRDDLLQGFGLAARVSRPGLGSSLAFLQSGNVAAGIDGDDAGRSDLVGHLARQVAQRSAGVAPGDEE